ncbi:MAG: MarR family transcriptional regulator [Sphingomonadales bacterium]|nr:MarR family transcriptional regulator [Sphingomonadales bacterium]
MPERNSDTLRLEDFLPYRLSVLSNRVSRTIAERYEERFQLSMSEWRVMAVLGESPGLSAGEVAVRTAMDKVAVSRAVNRLLETGRLERRFSDEDRRRSVLQLSAAGRKIYRDVVPIAKAYESELLNALSESESGQLNTLIDRLFESLDARASA